MPSVITYTSKAGAKTYRVRFRLNGAQSTLTFPTKPDAERFADDIERRGAAWAWETYLDGEQLKSEMTLAEWAERHFASMPHVSPATREGYERDWRRRWEPHLGHMKLSKITREDVTRALAAQPGADKTIENAWGTLATMFKTAVLDRHIDRSPTLGVKLGRRTTHEKVERRYLTPAEILQVVIDTPERYRPLIWTLAGTGMRWGEATALNVADVNLDARIIRVTKAWKRNREEGWYVGPTKTDKGKRTITLPGEVVDALEPVIRGRGRRELLFTNRDGNPVKHQPFYREHWTKACTRNLAEPRPRLHDLRHSHVAILIAGGAGLPIIQHRLGHEKITTTIDTYGHLMPDLHVAAAEITSRAFASAAVPKELG